MLKSDDARFTLVRNLTQEAARLQTERSRVAAQRSAEIRSLLNAGASYGQIAQAAGLSRSAIQSAVRQGEKS